MLHTQHTVHCMYVVCMMTLACDVLLLRRGVRVL